MPQPTSFVVIPGVEIRSSGGWRSVAFGAFVATPAKAVRRDQLRLKRPMRPRAMAAFVLEPIREQDAHETQSPEIAAT